jgi:dihydrofolate reductase
MTKVMTAMSVSLDGYVAGPGDSVEELFRWFEDGDTPSEFYPEFRMSAVSAEVFDGIARRNGAIVTGRRTYDVSDGWDGHGPMPGVPLYVVTHRPVHRPPPGDPPYVFVTEGVERAIELARERAVEKDVALMGGQMVQQALAAGLLDELTMHLVPVTLGGGVRLLEGTAAELELLRAVDAPGVTHLTYRVHSVL